MKPKETDLLLKDELDYLATGEAQSMTSDMEEGGGVMVESRCRRQATEIEQGQISNLAVVGCVTAELFVFSACVMIVGDVCITFFGATVKRWPVPGAPHAGQLLLSVCPRIASS